VSSSVFDFVTFAVLILVVRASPELFRTSWFVESLLTQLMMVLVMRTRRPFYTSRPGTLLLGLTAGMMVLAVVLPYLPIAATFGFVPLPGTLLAIILTITVAYVVTTDLEKRWFYSSRQ